MFSSITSPFSSWLLENIFDNDRSTEDLYTKTNKADTMVIIHAAVKFRKTSTSNDKTIAINDNILKKPFGINTSNMSNANKNVNMTK